MELPRESKHKACDLCKKRKVRCSGRQPCQNCLRMREQCVFNSPHGRLANAEKCVTRPCKRRRCVLTCCYRRAQRATEYSRLLELAWNKFVPNIPLETALLTVEAQGPPSQPQFESQEQFNFVTQIAIKSSLTSPEELSAIDERSPDDGDHDYEHQRADSLEWDESAGVASLSDGIGSLSIQSQGIGYMGPLSGNALLRNLQSFSGSALLEEDEISPSWSSKPQLTEDVLRSSSFASQCVDAYFRHYHPAYPIVHEGQFRAQLLAALPKPKDGSWPILYNTILAIGAHSGDFYHQNADAYFYQEACKHLSWDVLRRGSLPLVQALTLMANYLQKRDRPNSGFNLLGVSMNMAQGIGLHREFSRPSISIQAMEIRRRVWWTLFIFDSGARITFGRPPTTMSGINISLPINLDDKDLAVDLEELPPPKDHPTVTSSLIWQVKLAQIGNMANEHLLQAQVPSLVACLGFGKRLKEWRDSLPTYMREGSGVPDESIFNVPRMVLLWRSMHLRIVIFRPFILDAVKGRKLLDLEDPQSPHAQCIAAASECVQSIASFWSVNASRHGSLVWYACYWLVTALFVDMTCLLYDPQHLYSMEWRQEIELSKIALEDMATYELTAARAVRVVNQLMNLVPTSPDSSTLENTEPLRMEFAEFWNQGWTDFSLYQGDSAADPSSWPPVLITGHWMPSPNYVGFDKAADVAKGPLAAANPEQIGWPRR